MPVKFVVGLETLFTFPTSHPLCRNTLVDEVCELYLGVVRLLYHNLFVVGVFFQLGSTFGVDVIVFLCCVVHIIVILTLRGVAISAVFVVGLGVVLALVVSEVVRAILALLAIEARSSPCILSE